MAKLPTSTLGKIFNRAFFHYGPAQEALTLGATGSLLGRYLAAPLVSKMLLPQDLEEEEKEKRKRRIRNMFTFIGARPGLGTAAVHFGENRALNPEWGTWKQLTIGPGRMPEPKPEPPGRKEAGLLNAFGRKEEPDQPIPIMSTKMLIMSDPNIRIEDKAEILSYIDESAGGRKAGLLSSNNMLRAGLGAGLGWAGAGLASRVVGSIFGISEESKKRLKDMGAIAGLLYGSGVIGQ